MSLVILIACVCASNSPAEETGVHVYCLCRYVVIVRVCCCNSPAKETCICVLSALCAFMHVRVVSEQGSLSSGVSAFQAFPFCDLMCVTVCVHACEGFL